VNKEQEGILIGEVQNGDIRAYEKLVNHHRQFIYSLILRLVKHSEDAEELTMDVFVRAYQKLDTFRFDAKLSTWLYTIAYRIAIMHLRKKKRYFSEVKEHHSVADGFTDEIHQEEQRLILENAMAQLSYEDNALISFFYLKELSLKEIEEITKIKAVTIKVKIHRIRKKLAELLKVQLPAEELKTLI